MVGCGGSVTLVRHNLSIIPLAEHNFEHGTPCFTGDARKHNTLFFEHKPTNPNFG